jgi:hypothetical protein
MVKVFQKEAVPEFYISFIFHLKREQAITPIFARISSKNNYPKNDKNLWIP